MKRIALLLIAIAYLPGSIVYGATNPILEAQRKEKAAEARANAAEQKEKAAEAKAAKEPTLSDFFEPYQEKAVCRSDTYLRARHPTLAWIP